MASTFEMVIPGRHCLPLAAVREIYGEAGVRRDHDIHHDLPISLYPGAGRTAVWGFEFGARRVELLPNQRPDEEMLVAGVGGVGSQPRRVLVDGAIEFGRDSSEP